MATSGDLRPMSRAFSQSQNDQLTSPITRIPTEVRVKILRYLLKSDDFLDKDIKAGSTPFSKSFDLSAQILRTCQILHQEGIEILYEENTCVIEFSTHRSNLVLDLLDMRVNLPLMTIRRVGCLGDVATIVADDLPHCPASRQGGRPEISLLWLRDHHNVLDQFKRFRVNNIGHVSEAHLYYFCVLFRDVLLKKNVDVSCSLLEHSTLAATIEATSKICQALKCSSFTCLDQQGATSF